MDLSKVLEKRLSSLVQLLRAAFSVWPLVSSEPVLREFVGCGEVVEELLDRAVLVGEVGSC